MATQHAKQKSFIAYALGSTKPYTGMAMDAAHRKLVREGVDGVKMNDSHFDVIAEHLQSTLLELGVAPSLVGEVITKVAGLREQVMCRTSSA